MEPFAAQQDYDVEKLCDAVLAVFHDVRAGQQARSCSHDLWQKRIREYPFRARAWQPCFLTQVAEPCGAEVSKKNCLNTHCGFAY